jgi:hypothetical protein
MKPYGVKRTWAGDASGRQSAAGLKNVPLCDVCGKELPLAVMVWRIDCGRIACGDCTKKGVVQT